MRTEVSKYIPLSYNARLALQELIRTFKVVKIGRSYISGRNKQSHRQHSNLLLLNPAYQRSADAFPPTLGVKDGTVSCPYKVIAHRSTAEERRLLVGFQVKLA